MRASVRGGRREGGFWVGLLYMVRLRRRINTQFPWVFLARTSLSRPGGVMGGGGGVGGRGGIGGVGRRRKGGEEEVGREESGRRRKG